MFNRSKPVQEADKAIAALITNVAQEAKKTPPAQEAKKTPPAQEAMKTSPAQIEQTPMSWEEIDTDSAKKIVSS